MSFGKRLNQTRKAKGLTALKMADGIGVALRTYRCYESDDRQPPIETLVKIADMLDVSLDYLTERDEFLAKSAD